MIKIGVDVGSTTVKLVALKDNEILFSDYKRHASKARESIINILNDLYAKIGNQEVQVAIAGSAGLGIAESTNLPFVQEVIAATTAITNYNKNADVVIELGGEDAKIIFLGNHIEQRMNGTCAGGTGAFIDQMASLLNVTSLELNELAKNSTKTYQIASRCGVFAKSDIQPLLNQGALKEDLAASIFESIVTQTIVGLAQGRKIKGNIAFLGGPLYFLSELRNAFIKTLGLKEENIIFPDNAHLFVAFGAAIESENFEPVMLKDVIEKFNLCQAEVKIASDIEPLFNNEKEYQDFLDIHNRNSVQFKAISEYSGKAYLGVDSGSTTTKIVLIGENNELLYQFYSSSNGNPMNLLKEKLLELFKLCGDKIEIVSSAAVGYGEELMQKAFFFDFGYVETIAHYRAAKYFNEDVSFIIDIGGQDMKCMKIKNHAIDSISLNEACSSGCGSFIEMFAKALGYSTKEFAQIGLFAKHPANLGSRCTVFMNSSVKQAQKDGAGIDDVAAGLAISVVKNALYKVLRVKDINELGKNIVVQGGTFYNDSILRAFERELGIEVIRPTIAGIMGAYGAALLAKENVASAKGGLSLKRLEEFSYKTKNANCGLCSNNCLITINTFEDGRIFIAGNKCEKGANRVSVNDIPNTFRENYNALFKLPIITENTIGKIGIPLVLNFFDNYPFWNGFFNDLKIEIVLSAKSSKNLYQLGQQTIPSDTACYPAKMVHGHILDLIHRDVQTIFYPVIVYNTKEKKYVDNHYNCPVVAYYSELIKGNIDEVEKCNFLNPYIEIGSKNFNKMMLNTLKPYFPSLTLSKIKEATINGWKIYKEFQEMNRINAQIALAYAEENKLQTIVLAGRPYHLDSAISHSIDQLLNQLEVVVIAENHISHLGESSSVKVLNQWTYHSRLYDAATFIKDKANIDLVQLISFGCGLDAITSDETREILEQNHKIYTQIKIDEISNLGAAKIRLRSLLEAIKDKKKETVR